MSDDDDKVVFLAFSNPDAVVDDAAMMACATCRNKAFSVKYDAEDFPGMYCTACGRSLGRIGWAEGVTDG